jgi:hypothetical protein
MLGESTKTLDRVTDYNKQPDGRWHADVYYPVRLHVEGGSPSDCRFQMIDKFDAVLSDWLERTQKEPDRPISSSAGITSIWEKSKSS